MPDITTLKPILATEGIPKYTGDSGYDGPSVGWLLANHKLAHQVIACHPIESQKVFDSDNLAMLRQYVENPTSGKELLEQWDMVDKEGDKPGARANGKYGSLVGHIIATDAFDESELEMLREWFASGVLDKELEGVGSKAGRKVMPSWKGD